MFQRRCGNSDVKAKMILNFISLRDVPLKIKKKMCFEQYVNGNFFRTVSSGYKSCISCWRSRVQTSLPDLGLP